ncbi:MAG: hypothetical protein IKQ04_03250 [Oscillospiraceae bacterium]|nr:hypothetical protein [Oscillospiraceae bacterium]
MGKFIPGSSFFAFTDEQWGFLLTCGITDYIQTDIVDYTKDGTHYRLVDMQDLLEDEGDLDFDLYEFSIAVFTDSVQANIKGPGEW